MAMIDMSIPIAGKFSFAYGTFPILLFKQRFPLILGYPIGFSFPIHALLLFVGIIIISHTLNPMPSIESMRLFSLLGEYFFVFFSIHLVLSSKKFSIGVSICLALPLNTLFVSFLI